MIIVLFRTLVNNYFSKTDYDFARNMPEHFPWKSVTFEADCYLEDGAALDFGDIKIKAMHTPGHTAGCFSLIIPVTDEGRKQHAQSVCFG